MFDLETTGGSAAAGAQITEVGAVKVRGGRTLGELATLVRPAGPIPPYVAMLTGITDATVADAPPIDAVLPSFLEFARGCVLVAHNAPFDVGFMRAACERTGRPWPAATVVDTVALARRALHRDEVRDCKLATLAGFFAARTAPRHRALDDARATVDVLHGLLERLGGYGVTSLEELTSFSARPTTAQRRKRHLADGVPSAPGVYLFRDAHDAVLYVGKSADLRRRVRSYFGASETRRRIREMVGIAERVTTIACATGLEAEIRELRLIAEHKPPYNKRSKFPERDRWIKLTVEPFPRLSIVREVRDDGTCYLGPFSSSRAAELARDGLHEALRLRRCTPRLSPRRRTAPCVLAELGRCGAPCDGGETERQYARHVVAARDALAGDVRAAVAAQRTRIAELAGGLRYEEAATHRDRLAAYLHGAARRARLTALAHCRELVAGAPRPSGGWDLAVVRHGRLAAAGVLPAGAHPDPYVSALRATAETVPAPAPATITARATAEEMECVLRWLDGRGVRLAHLDGTWSCPVHGGEREARAVEGAVRAARAQPTGAPGSDDRRTAGRPLG